MIDFSTLVGRYNASALSLQDGEFSTLALDSASRIIQDHSTSSIKVGDGADILDIMANDSVAALTEKGLGILAVRKDSVASLVGSDGDFSFLQVDANGRLRVDAEVSVTTGSDKEEDTAHSSGAIGAFILGVRNDADAVLTSDDGDYSPIAVDNKGRIKSVTDIKEQGTEEDIGVDEAGNGEIDVAYHATNFVDLASITVAAGETLFIKGFDLSSDVLIEGRLVVWDSAQDPGAEVIAVLRKLPVTENIGWADPKFTRAKEVAGGATISVKLQARCMRAGKTAHCGGGINAYK